MELDYEALDAGRQHVTGRVVARDELDAVNILAKRGLKTVRLVRRKPPEVASDGGKDGCPPPTRFHMRTGDALDPTWNTPAADDATPIPSFPFRFSGPSETPGDHQDALADGLIPFRAAEVVPPVRPRSQSVPFTPPAAPQETDAPPQPVAPAGSAATAGAFWTEADPTAAPGRSMRMSARPKPVAPPPASMSRRDPAASPWYESLHRLAGSLHRAGSADRALQLSVAFRELAVMHQAGLPLLRALENLAATSNDEFVAEGFAAAAHAVEGGKTLAEGMARREAAFPAIALQLVSVGERTGRLGILCDRIATLLDRKARMAMKMRSALTYPLFLLVCCGLMLVFVPSLLFDGIFAMLRDMHAPVPLPTRLMMDMAVCVKSPLAWLAAAGGCGVIGWTYHRAMRVEARRLWRDRALLRLPLVGPCLRWASLFTFSQTLNTLYSSGIPILESLRGAGRSTGNHAFRLAGDEMASAVQAGIPIHRAAEMTGLFPSAFVSMASAGDQTGRLSEMLEVMARLSHEEVENRINSAMAALEPIIMYVMGCLVCLIVLATVSPLLKVLQSLAV